MTACSLSGLAPGRWLPASAVSPKFVGTMPYRNEKPDVPRHRLRRVLLIVLLTPLLLCAVVAGILVLKTSAIAGHVVDRLVPVMEQRMGRDVQVGTVTARLFPRPHAVVSELRIAGAPGEPEIIHAGQTYVMVEPWPLVRSLGKDIRVDAIELRDTRLNLVRRADGSWNYEDVQRAIGGGSDREYVVSRFSLVNGALSWRDAARGGNATVALEKIDLTARDIGPGLPVSLDFSAALAAGGKNLSGYLRLNRLPDEADAKDAPPPAITGRLTLKGASLERFSGLLPAQLDALASGGQVGFEAAVSTTPEGTYVLDGKAQVEALKLRGEPARGGAHLVAKVPAAKPDALTVQLRDIVLQGAGVDLTGSANLALSPPAARFDLQGPLLDLNQLLALRPEQPEQPEPSSGPLVSAEMRETLADVTVTGSLALGEVRSGSLKAQDVHADVTLKRGVLNVRQGRARLYGGNTRLDGTKVNLLAARPVWDLEATLEGVDLGQAVAEVSKQRPISGRVNGKLSLHGDGNDWAELRERLTGKGALTVQEGALSADLGERIGTPLREALARAGRGAAAGKVEAAQGTRLQDLAASFTLEDGWLKLSRPLALRTSVGDAALSGRVGLDWRLDLSGNIALAPPFVARVSGGRFAPEGPLEVPLGMGGTVGDPKVRLQATPEMLVKGLAQTGPGKQLQDRVQREVQGRLKGVMERIRR